MILTATNSKPQDVIDDLQELIDNEPDDYLNQLRWTLCTARDYLKGYFDTLLNEDGTERITLDRLAELVDAERDGKCVILGKGHGLLSTWETPTHCPNCWDHTSTDWSFCPECGTPINRAEAEAKGAQE